jgi:hypothetical protein
MAMNREEYEAMAQGQVESWTRLCEQSASRYAQNPATDPPLHVS